MPLEFTRSDPLTFGVELELMVLNTHDYNLVRGAPDLLARLEKVELEGEVKPEITESMIEVNSAVNTRYGELLDELLHVRDAIVVAADRLNVAVAGGGAHPFHKWKERRIFQGERFQRVSGLYILMLKDTTFFFADTTVNIDPTAEELAEIALLTADAVRRFDIEPRLALISFSNFGSNTQASPLKVKRAVELIRAARPDLAVDGEMQADLAVVPELLEADYPWATVKRPNILIFPNLDTANAAYKLVWRVAGAEAIGPILLGMAKPVHVLQRGVEVADIVNMAAIAVVDAQEKEEARRR